MVISKNRKNDGIWKSSVDAKPGRLMLDEKDNVYIVQKKKPSYKSFLNYKESSILTMEKSSRCHLNQWSTSTSSVLRQTDIVCFLIQCMERTQYHSCGILAKKCLTCM